MKREELLKEFINYLLDWCSFHDKTKAYEVVDKEILYAEAVQFIKDLEDGTIDSDFGNE